MKSMQFLLAVMLLALLVAPSLGQSPTGAMAPSKDTVQTIAVPARATPATPADAADPHESALEFARYEIELETQRLDKLINSTEIVGTLMVALVIGSAAILTYFGYNSVREMKGELQASVESTVEKALKDQSKSGQSFEELVKKLSTAQERWSKVEKSIDNLERFEAQTGPLYGDAQGAYRMAEKLSKKKDITPDERRAALGCLLTLIELGEQGKVDPNLLFNASTVASEMDFDHEGLKLASLCAHWDPKPTHNLRKSRHEDTFGMRFELRDHKLVLSEQPPTVVRAEAWKAARDLVRQAPTHQCELIFAELHNIAVRNRESGYINDAIAVMEDLIKRETVPSYAYALLSGFYAMRGDSTWLADYLSAASKAIDTLMRESPASTWYFHTTRELRGMARRTGTQAHIAALIKDKGLPTVDDATESDEE